MTNFEASSLLENAGNVVNLELAFDAPPEGMEYQEWVLTIRDVYSRPSCGIHVYLSLVCTHVQSHIHYVYSDIYLNVVYTCTY